MHTLVVKNTDTTDAALAAMARGYHVVSAILTRFDVVLIVTGATDGSLATWLCEGPHAAPFPANSLLFYAGGAA